MKDLEHEQLHTLKLNAKNRVISSPMIYQGSVHTTAVRMAEIFRPAIIDNATVLIIAHNRPSGDPLPSPEDSVLTREIVKTDELLGLDVQNHLVIGRGKLVSLRERTWILNIRIRNWAEYQMFITIRVIP